MARRGSWSGMGGPGGLTVNPFGSTSGSLSGYNLGDAVSSIEAANRYAISVGWQNGVVTDEEYLDALRHWVSITVEGSRERISAENELSDAIYTIGRNKLVRAVNNAATDDKRVAAYRDLIAYDRKKLATMVVDNEQRRELVDRITGAEVDIRSTSWASMVRRYNENRLSNAQMLAFAKNARKDAQGAPDMQSWDERVFEFSERIADERLSQLYQDYEHDRIGGGQVLAYIDQRMSGMDRNSPRYADLRRSREDFAKSWRSDEMAQEYAAKYDAHQEGRLGDDEWLTFLNRRVEQSPPGSEERREAKHDLASESFRITENRLYYDVYVKGEDPQVLIRFWQRALLSMDHDSARAYDLRQKINKTRIEGIESINLGSDTATPTGNGHFIGGGANDRNSTYTRWRDTDEGSGGDAVEAMIDAAKGYLGTRYRLGQEGANGIDCSGLIYRAFIDAGLGDLIGNDRKKAAGYTRLLASQGQYTQDRAELKRGDMVVYTNPGGGRISHIGIYLGNGKVMSALTTTGVTIHRMSGINKVVSGFLLMDWTGARPDPSSRVNLPSDRQRRRATNPAPMPDVIDDEEEPAQTRGRNDVAQRDPLDRGPRRRDEANTTVQFDRTVAEGPRRDRAQDGGPAGDSGDLDNLPGAVRDIAADLVRRLGGNPQNEEAVRAVAAWVIAENGQSIQGNNPLNLQTAGGQDLPGQLNKTADGYAIFESWQAGNAAAANELARHYPELADAIRRGSAEDFLTSLERSDWRPQGYGNTLIQRYNETEPSRRIIGGGTKVFQGPQSLPGMAGIAPDIRELFDVNPGDATQMEWFDKNLAALEDAYEHYDPTGQRPRTSFIFETADGTHQQLTFSPELYYSVLDAKAHYEAASGNTDAASSAINKLRDTRFEVTTDQFDFANEVFSDGINQMLLNGDVTGAYNFARQRLAMARDLLGIPQGVEISVDNYRGELTNDQLERLRSKIDRVRPQTENNPTGDWLLGMTDPAARTPTGETPLIFDPASGRVAVNPNAVYFVQDGDGRLSPVTWRDRPADFIPSASRADAFTGVTTSQVPAYMNRLVRLNLDGVDPGVPLMAAPTVTDVSALRIDSSKPPPPAAPSGFASGPLGALPDPAAMRRSWLTPKASDSLNKSPAPGIWNPSAPLPSAPPAPAPSDESLAIPAGGTVKTWAISWYDPRDGRRYTGYSLDDPATSLSTRFVLRPDDPLLPMPALVLNKDSRAQFLNGVLVVVDEMTGKPRAYSADKDGPLSGILHWYGTDPGDLPSGKRTSQGAPNAWLPVRDMVAGNISISLNVYERNAFRTGLSPGEQINRPAPVARQTAPVVEGVTRPVYGPPTPPPVSPNVNAATGFTIADTPNVNRSTGFSLPRMTGSTVASNTRMMASMALARANRIIAATAPPPPTVAPQARPVAPPPAATPKVRPTPTYAPPPRMPEPRPSETPGVQPTRPPRRQVAPEPDEPAPRMSSTRPPPRQAVL